MKKLPKRRTLKYMCAIGCEGLQEKKYFEHLQSLVNIESDKKIHLKCNEMNIGDMKRNYVEYDRVFVFDNDDKQDEFEAMIKSCSDEGIIHAYSNRCFDLWLLLHKEHCCRPARSNDEYINDVRKAYALKLRRNDIKNEKVIDGILKQIKLNDVKKAVVRADKIINSKLSHNKIICSHKMYDDPDFTIHIFVRNVLNKAGIKI